METIEELVASIHSLTNHYQPNAGVTKSLREKTAVGVVGPFGVGKSTLMQRVEALDKEFSYVLGITTRPKRPGESDTIYRFLDHSAEQLALIKQQLENGELVQIALHPSTGYAYGTDIESYKTRFNVLDILTTALDEFAVLPFASFKKIYVVAPVKQWLKRIAEREGVQTPQDLQKRWQEARINLEWALSHQSEVDFVANSDGNLDDTAKRIISIARDGIQGADESKLIKDMLDEVYKRVV